MIDFMEYRIGIWVGEVTRRDLNQWWKDSKNVSAHWDSEDLAKVFPNGWTAAQFTGSDARSMIVDPLPILDEPYQGVVLERPEMFWVDPTVLLSFFREDPSLIEDWADFSVFLPSGSVPGVEHDVAISLDMFAPVGHESPLTWELEMAGLDSFDGWWEDIAADLVRFHLSPDRKEEDSLQYTYHHGGFLVYSGVIAISADYHQSGGYGEEPPDAWIEIDYLGRVDFTNMTHDHQKGLVCVPLVTGQVDQVQDRPRSILDLK